MISHFHLIVEMTERQRELERLVYPKGLVNRRMCNHVYRHLALRWERKPASLQARLKPAASDC